MQLIDVLEARSDGVRLIEYAEKVEANYRDEQWALLIDGADYILTEDSFDTLLNLLRIPIKYIKRCVEDEGVFLAESSINYWLSKYDDLSFLITELDGSYYVNQVFPGKRLYIPGFKINDLIFEYLGGDVSVKSFVINDDVYSALYLTNETVTIGGYDYSLGVKVVYSDCFTITPRFDSVLFSEETGATFAYPVVGRKFRVANSTIPQVFEQVQEFLDLAISGLRETLIPKLQDKADDDNLISIHEYIGKMVSQLRLPKKVESELLSAFIYLNYPVIEIMEGIGAYTSALPDETNIDVELGRDIQIAMSNYIVKESFK